MKLLFIFLLGITIIALTVQFFSSYLQNIANKLSYNACDIPLSYSLGFIDQRFGLSNGEVLNEIKSATDIWSNSEGKKIFVYSQNAKLKVSLVYDQRQALDTTINQLNTDLNNNNMKLQQQIDSYNAQVASFKQQIIAFKEKVNKYNQEGGAPPSVYKDLINEENQLNAEGNSLNDQAKQLNLSTNDFNVGVSVLNGDINQFNIDLSKKPEEGIFNGGNNTITIYFANNRQELIHTLAHEFGHALGMVHVSNSMGIMYPYTTSFIMVTSDDIQQLGYVCRKQSLLVHWKDEIDLWLMQQLQGSR